METAERDWKRITAEWEAIQEPRDLRTIAERRRIYPELAVATTDLVENDYHMARLDKILNDRAAEIVEINQLLAEMDNPTG